MLKAREEENQERKKREEERVRRELKKWSFEVHWISPFFLSLLSLSFFLFLLLLSLFPLSLSSFSLIFLFFSLCLSFSFILSSLCSISVFWDNSFFQKKELLKSCLVRPYHIRTEILLEMIEKHDYPNVLFLFLFSFPFFFKMFFFIFFVSKKQKKKTKQKTKQKTKKNKQNKTKIVWSNKSPYCFFERRWKESWILIERKSKY